MDEYHYVVRTETALANVGDHRGGAFTRIDRIENDALVPAKKQYRFVACLAWDAVTLVDEIVEILDLTGLDLYIESQHCRRLVGDRSGAVGHVVLVARGDAAHREAPAERIFR